MFARLCADGKAKLVLSFSFPKKCLFCLNQTNLNGVSITAYLEYCCKCILSTFSSIFSTEPLL